MQNNIARPFGDQPTLSNDQGKNNLRSAAIRQREVMTTRESTLALCLEARRLHDEAQSMRKVEGSELGDLQEVRISRIEFRAEYLASQAGAAAAKSRASNQVPSSISPILALQAAFTAEYELEDLHIRGGS
ncbi:hypothetical protein [Pseudomonas sp. EMN2]|uniref:hypothetical protein n=1 Tax=Pseudomonas sp. EMN2 TaxID=2615212 RepID=UPI00129B520F|nr:hypothetical protein [Pseudomonas sp. EMN2]